MEGSVVWCGGNEGKKEGSEEGEKGGMLEGGGKKEGMINESEEKKERME